MAALLSYALTSVADAKESLGISSGDTSKDNLITRKINQATEAIESYCQLEYGHHFKQTAYSNELFDGTGTDKLILRMRPVSSAETFTLDERDNVENISSWTTVNTDLYFVNYNAGVVSALFPFIKRPKLYRVTYTAGYSTIPFDLAEACVTVAAYLVENGTSGMAIKSKTEGQRKIEYQDPGKAGAGEGSNSLFTQLNIDELLNRYLNYGTIEDV